MLAANRKTNSKTEIRALIDDRAAAVRAKSVEKAMSNIASNILSFDVINPLQYTGSDSSEKRTAQWFSSFQGPIGFEVRDLAVTAGDDLAFSHSLNHVNGAMMDGRNLDMWWRSTVCYRKMNGKWLIVHEHNSVPFDAANGKASLDLKP